MNHNDTSMARWHHWANPEPWTQTFICKEHWRRHNLGASWSDYRRSCDNLRRFRRFPSNDLSRFVKHKISQSSESDVQTFALRLDYESNCSCWRPEKVPQVTPAPRQNSWAPVSRLGGSPVCSHPERLKVRGGSPSARSHDDSPPHDDSHW